MFIHEHKGFTAHSPAALAKLVAETMRDGMWELDFSSRMFHYSRDFSELFGAGGTHTLRGKPLDEWLESVHPDDRQRVMNQWQGLLDNDSPYRLQYRIMDNLGNWRWVAATICAVIRNANGGPDKVTGFHLDITDAVRNEQILATSQERLRLIFEHAGIGIVTSNINGMIEQANPAIAMILGRRVGDIVGHTLSDFARPEDCVTIEEGLHRLVHGGRNEVVNEQRFLRADGTIVWTNMTGTISSVDVDTKRFVVAMIEDITERRRRQTKLFHDATHDDLTGAWSRGVLLERLGQHINLAVRHHQPMAFCIADLDHFKQINDQYGHQTGDTVLVDFVKILNKAVRDTDVVGRYGGEEFAIVFPNTDTQGAADAMERARNLFREKKFFSPHGGDFSVTASFGIAGVTKNCSVHTMIADADRALYESKNSGRDRVSVAG